MIGLAIILRNFQPTAPDPVLRQVPVRQVRQVRTLPQVFDPAGPAEIAGKPLEQPCHASLAMRTTQPGGLNPPKWQYTDAKCRLLEATVRMSQRCLTSASAKLRNDLSRFIERMSCQICYRAYQAQSEVSVVRRPTASCGCSVMFVGRPRRSRDQRHAIRCNCRPGPCERKMPAGLQENCTTTH